MRPHSNSNRHFIHQWLATSQPWRGRVLDLGCSIPNASAWWADNRQLFPDHDYTGCDVKPGYNVDDLYDGLTLPYAGETFGTVLMVEVLEHCVNPAQTLAEAHRVLQHGGKLVLTTLFAFPEHQQPRDYWRFTANGLKALLESAGFVNINTQYANEINFSFRDHSAEVYQAMLPTQVFAVGVKPNL